MTIFLTCLIIVYLVIGAELAFLHQWQKRGPQTRLQFVLDFFKVMFGGPLTLILLCIKAGINRLHI